MSRGSYECDSSGSLMPMIRALIKPPDELMNPPKPKKNQHPYYKRPGKGHNRDCCDACQDGGDLICCDRCPASFHLNCCDPPLELEDLPAGLWLCKACKASEAACGGNYRPLSPIETRGRRRNTGGKANSKKRIKARREEALREEARREELRREEARRAAAKVEAGLEAEEKNQEGNGERKNDTEKELTPMDLLIKAAKAMNPKQFDLPKEMKIPILFPGTGKRADKRRKKGRGVAPRWGTDDAPAVKECYVCCGNSKKAPLLQCDYCPLLFHQDCLTPPMTALPIGRWMCPNHVENFIDMNLVNTISATERVALWDMFSGPIDHHAIKMDFLRRARRNNPAFRIKVPAPQRTRILVPAMVQHHYHNPPPMMPSRREFVRCANVLKRLKATGTYDESDEERDMTEDSKYKICLNLSCPGYTGEGTCPLESTRLLGASVEEAEHDLKSITQPKVIKERAVNPSTSDHSDSDLDHQIHATVKKRKLFTAGTASPKNQQRPTITLREDSEVDDLLSVADDQLKDLDRRVLKILAWQRAQQIAAGEQLTGKYRGVGGTTQWMERSVAAIKAPERERPQALGVNVQPVQSDLIETVDRNRISSALWGDLSRPPSPTATLAPSRHQPLHRLARSTRSDFKNAFIIATLLRIGTPLGCYIRKLDRPIPMRSSSLRVGSQANCDLVLDEKCRHVSPMHAIIFHDQVTNHFELLNYSEWGTYVNGVMYVCDINPLSDPSDSPEAAADARASVLRNLVGKHVPPKPRLDVTLTEEVVDPCNCPKKPPTSVGAWEGSALVPHGALIQFGCYKFVFSITDAVAFPYESKSKDPPAL